MMRFPILLAAAVLGAAPAHADEDEMRAVRAMIAFDKTCVETAAQPKALKKLVAPKQPLALPPMTGKPAETFLAGRPGTVWHMPPQIGEAALAITDDGTCTLFIGRIDAGALLGVAEAWWEKHATYELKPAGQFDAAYVSRHYRLEPRKGKKATALKLVVSVSDGEDAPYQAAVSVSR